MFNKLSYSEMTEVVEEFMRVTRIREYCVELCKGDCCPKDCVRPCYMTGERRLMCSLFICLNLQKLIFDCLQMKKYNEDVRIPMSRIVAKWIKKSENSKKIESFPTQLVYFIPYPEEVKEKILFPYNLKRNLEILSCPDVIHRVEILINMSKTVIRADKTKETKIAEEVRNGR